MTLAEPPTLAMTAAVIRALTAYDESMGRSERMLADLQDGLAELADAATRVQAVIR